MLANKNDIKPMTRAQLIALFASMLAALAMMAVLFTLASSVMRAEMVQQAKSILSILDNINSDAVSSWSRLSQSTHEPCSDPHLTEMRAELFLTWHVKDIAFIKEGALFCTAAQGVIPKPGGLEEPDYQTAGGASIWINYPWPVLDTLRNTAIALRHNYGVVIDPGSIDQFANPSYPWQMTFQITEHLHHVAGTQGLSEAPFNNFGFFGDQRVRHCNAYFYCVVTQGNSWKYIGQNFLLAILSVLLSYCFGWVIYAKLVRAIRRYHSLPSRIARGFRKQRFYPLFQPIVSLETNTIVGCEVLARFRDHDGEAYPDQFISIVADNNMSWPFTQWMIEQSLEALEEAGLHNTLAVSFNLFPRDISSGAVLALLDMPSIINWPGKITLELTEDERVEEADAQASLHRLKEAGIDIAIDDFGTGYSNLKYIDKLHCRYLKIDRTFVMDVEEGSIRSSIIPHIVSIADKAQLVVVAEGVENYAQVEALAAMGIKYVQGYYFGKPMSAAQLHELVTAEAKL